MSPKSWAPIEHTKLAWYQHGLVTGIALFFCFPLGLGLMWAYQKKWHIVVKSAISALFAIFIIAVFVVGSSYDGIKSTTPSSPVIVEEHGPSTSKTKSVRAIHKTVSINNSARRSIKSERWKTNQSIARPAVLVNIGAIFGKSYHQVNKIIGGRPFYTESHAPGELYGFPNGAMERDYGSDGQVPAGATAASFSVDFDTDGKAKAVSFISFGPLENYKTSQWRTVLNELGLPNQPEPDKFGSQGMTWNSPSPYHIVMGGEKSGNISLLQIMPSYVQDQGEKQP